MRVCTIISTQRLVGGWNPLLLSPIDRSWFSIFFAFEIRLRQWWCVISSTVIVTPRYSARVNSRTISPASESGSLSFGSEQMIEHLAMFQVISFVTAQVAACLSSARSPSLDLARSCTSSARMMTGLLLLGSSAITLRENESINTLYRDGLVTDPCATPLLNVPTSFESYPTVSKEVGLSMCSNG